MFFFPDGAQKKQKKRERDVFSLKPRSRQIQMYSATATSTPIITEHFTLTRTPIKKASHMAQVTTTH